MQRLRHRGTVGEVGAPGDGPAAGGQVTRQRRDGGAHFVEGQGTVGAEHRDAHGGRRRHRRGLVEAVADVQRDAFDHLPVGQALGAQRDQPLIQRHRCAEVDVDASQAMSQAARVTEQPARVLRPLGKSARLLDHQFDFVQRQLVEEDRDRDGDGLLRAHGFDRVGHIPQQPVSRWPQFAGACPAALDRPHQVTAAGHHPADDGAQGHPVRGYVPRRAPHGDEPVTSGQCAQRKEIEVGAGQPERRRNAALRKAWRKGELIQVGAVRDQEDQGVVAVECPQLGQVVVVDDDLESADHPRGHCVPGAHDRRNVRCRHLAHVDRRLGLHIGHITTQL